MCAATCMSQPNRSLLFPPLPNAAGGLSPSNSGRAHQYKAALIFVFVTLLYFFTRSPGLDEWDSVQFALGVQHFNIWEQQPHPPGYPLYIFLGRLGHVLFHLEPMLSLQAASCLGGGLFVATWFLIIRRQLGERFAWFIGGCLAITPIVWMTSTKTMTDSVAAGLLSTQLLCSLLYQRDGRMRNLLGAGLLGAAAAGARPQLFAVVLAIVILALARRRPALKTWLTGIGIFLGGCLLWLLPMWYLQAQLRPDLPAWLVYPTQVYGQWRWRLDRPNIYIGAGDWSPGYLGKRFAYHILGWLGVGLGFMRSAFTLGVAFLLTGAGVASYFLHLREEDREFWKAHRVWAALHIAIIFCCLPAHQRYYLIIMPLLLVVLGRGLLSLPGRWRLSSMALPALLLWISIPIAITNHKEEAPPLQFARYLERQHPMAQRKDVLLLLSQCRRHVEWYAPGFVLAPKEKSVADIPPDQLAAAKAIYTDDPKLSLTPGWRLVRMAIYHRSLLIASKHRDIGVYKLERTELP